MLGLNPWTYKGGGGGGRGVDAAPHKVFLQFFQEEFLSAPVVFRSCTHVHGHIMANFSDIDCSGDTLSSKAPCSQTIFEKKYILFPFSLKKVQLVDKKHISV